MLLTGEQISYSRFIVNEEITANIMCSFRTNTRWYWSEMTSNSMKISVKTFSPENQCIKVISMCSYKIVHLKSHKFIVVQKLFRTDCVVRVQFISPRTIALLMHLTDL